MVQIVTLASTFSDPGEDRETTMGLGDVVLQVESALVDCLVGDKGLYNQLLNEHCLANTGTSEETNFSTASIRSKEIYDFDTGDKYFSGRRLLNEFRSISMNWLLLGMLDGPTLINWLTSDVHDTA